MLPTSQRMAGWQEDFGCQWERALHGRASDPNEARAKNHPPFCTRQATSDVARLVPKFARHHRKWGVSAY